MDIDFKNKLADKGLYHIILLDQNTFGLNGPSRANEIESGERNFGVIKIACLTTPPLSNHPPVPRCPVSA